MAFKLGSRRGNTDNKLTIGGNKNMVGGIRVQQSATARNETYSPHEAR